MPIHTRLESLRSLLLIKANIKHKTRYPAINAIKGNRKAGIRSPNRDQITIVMSKVDGSKYDGFADVSVCFFAKYPLCKE